MAKKKEPKEIKKESTGNRVLEAHWSYLGPELEIKYNLNDGVLPEDAPEIFLAGVGLEELPTPKKVGYNFVGLFLEEEFTTKVESIEKGRTEGITLYASWELAEFTITYVLVRATGLSITRTYTINDLNPSLELLNPTREDAEFLGWYTDITFATGEVTEITEDNIGDLTLYAKWSTWEDEEFVDASFNEDTKELVVASKKEETTKSEN